MLTADRPPRPITLVTRALCCLCALSLAPALAQGPARASRDDPLTYMARYLGDPVLHRELRLTPDQAKQLTAFRDNWYQGKGGPGVPRKGGLRVRQVDRRALTKILTPRQLERLEQVGLQLMEKSPSSGLSRDPDLARKLKLTEDQKNQLAARARLIGVLTDEQWKAWRRLVGKPFTERLVAFRGDQPATPGTVARPSPPVALQYLANRDVQEELKLGAKQAEQIRLLCRKWSRPFASRTDAARDRETKAVLAAVLTPARARRLEQIIRQVSVRGESAYHVFVLAEVIGGLELTPAQQEKIAGLRAEWRKGVVKLLLQEKGARQIQAEVARSRRELDGRIDRALSARQRAKLKELLGEPFHGEANPDRPLNPFLLPRFYLVLDGLPYAESPDLHAELKLDAEQVKKLVALATGRSRPGMAGGGRGKRPAARDSDPEKVRADRAGEAEKSLAGLLSPGQFRRFKQVILQSRTGPSSGDGLLQFPEVVAALKLTPRQKARLRDGEEVGDVLDAAQQKQWEELRGEPFKGKLRRPPNPVELSAVPPLPGVGRLLELESVRKNLKLSAAQADKVPELERRWLAAFARPAFAIRDVLIRQEERARQVRSAVREFNAMLAKLLEPRQLARLRQIELQQAQRSGLLGTPAAVRELGLSEGQNQRIQEIARDTTRLRRLAARELGGGRSRSGPAEVAAALEKVRQKRVLGVLTAKQRARLREMQGPPFEGELRQRWPPSPALPEGGG